MVKIKNINERLFASGKDKADLKQKLKQLTDESKLPEYIGELFLAEIRLSTDEANRHLRQRAKWLKLM
jgi:hypothetical protein